MGSSSTTIPGKAPIAQTEPSVSGRIRIIGFTGMVFAVLQSACAAVLAISGLRVAIGFTALAAASSIYAPASGFHQDAIRIPMLIVGGAGALINLAVLIRVWRLRARASANWRRRAVSPRERRAERLQLVLALVTLFLIGAEVITHPMVHRSGPAPLSQHHN